MLGIKCNCGQILRYGSIPSSIEWLMIAEVDYIGMFEKWNAEELYQAVTPILQCDQCRRL